MLDGPTPHSPSSKPPWAPPEAGLQEEESQQRARPTRAAMTTALRACARLLPPRRHDRVLLLAAVASTAVAAVGVLSPGPLSLTDSERGAGGGAGPLSLPRLPSAFPSSASPASSRVKDRVADIGDLPVNTPEIMALQPCTPAGLTVRVKSAATAYAMSDHPTFFVSIRSDDSGGDGECRVDLGRNSSLATITTAEGGHVWSSGDCPRSRAHRWVRLAADEPVTETFRWDRSRSGPRCATPRAGGAGEGPYRATATVGGLIARADFRLGTTAATTDGSTISEGTGDSGPTGGGGTTRNTPAARLPCQLQSGQDPISYDHARHTFCYDPTAGNLVHKWSANGGNWRRENLDGDSGSVLGLDGDRGLNPAAVVYRDHDDLTLQLFYMTRKGVLVHTWNILNKGWKTENLAFGEPSAFGGTAQVGGKPTANVHEDGSLHVTVRSPDGSCQKFRTSPTQPWVKDACQN